MLRTRNLHLKDSTFALISASMFYAFYLKNSTNQISLRKSNKQTNKALTFTFSGNL